VSHPTYLPDLTIANLYLFGIVKHKLQDIYVSDNKELKSEILMIFQGIPSGELKNSFDH
jgi:hypothetical protein